MSKPLLTGSELKCSFGDTTNLLFVTPLPIYPTCEGKQIALDNMTVPYVNIKMFGKCSSLVNPLVASATAAASGVLQPQVCTPMTVGAKWAPVSTVMRYGNCCVALATSKCRCIYQGEISVINPVQTQVTTK